MKYRILMLFMALLFSLACGYEADEKESVDITIVGDGINLSGVVQAKELKGGMLL